MILYTQPYQLFLSGASFPYVLRFHCHGNRVVSRDRLGGAITIVDFWWRRTRNWEATSDEAINATEPALNAGIS